MSGLCQDTDCRGSLCAFTYAGELLGTSAREIFKGLGWHRGTTRLLHPELALLWRVRALSREGDGDAI